MAKHSQTIRRLLPTNCLSVFDHFVGLALKWLNIKGVHILMHLYITGLLHKCMTEKCSLYYKYCCYIVIKRLSLLLVL